MLCQIMFFVFLFAVTAIIHKPLNVHETKKRWLQVTHYWLEYAVVIQGIIIVNEFLKLI
jgi:hypothetical protein